MSKLITLTDSDRKGHLVNTNSIIYVEDNDDYRMVYFGNYQNEWELEVTESLEEIQRLVNVQD